MFEKYTFVFLYNFLLLVNTNKAAQDFSSLSPSQRSWPAEKTIPGRAEFSSKSAES